ncbi:hypothetical protein I552_1887 [Mycobacterium xenopi 3993]|nr:hypothetical protein I552_1887 [Mycobacterium xenopi 3993]
MRCEDPALLAQAVATPAAEQLQLRVLAPTVAVSQAPISEVLAALRDGGFARPPRIPRALSSTSASAVPECPPPSIVARCARSPDPPATA